MLSWFYKAIIGLWLIRQLAQIGLKWQMISHVFVLKYRCSLFCICLCAFYVFITLKQSNNRPLWSISSLFILNWPKKCFSGHNQPKVNLMWHFKISSKCHARVWPQKPRFVTCVLHSTKAWGQVSLFLNFEKVFHLLGLINWYWLNEVNFHNFHH